LGESNERLYSAAGDGYFESVDKGESLQLLQRFISTELLCMVAITPCISPPPLGISLYIRNEDLSIANMSKGKNRSKLLAEVQKELSMSHKQRKRRKITI